MLVEIDPRDYQVALDKAQADVADAEAAAIAATKQCSGHVGADHERCHAAKGGVDRPRAA